MQSIPGTPRSFHSTRSRINYARIGETIDRYERRNQHKEADAIKEAFLNLKSPSRTYGETPREDSHGRYSDEFYPAGREYGRESYGYTLYSDYCETDCPQYKRGYESYTESYSTCHSRWGNPHNSWETERRSSYTRRSSSTSEYGRSDTRVGYNYGYHMENSRDARTSEYYGSSTEYYNARNRRDNKSSSRRSRRDDDRAYHKSQTPHLSPPSSRYADTYESDRHNSSHSKSDRRNRKSSRTRTSRSRWDDDQPSRKYHDVAQTAYLSSSPSRYSETYERNRRSHTSSKSDRRNKKSRARVGSDKNKDGQNPAKSAQHSKEGETRSTGSYTKRSVAEGQTTRINSTSRAEGQTRASNKARYNGAKYMAQPGKKRYNKWYTIQEKSPRIKQHVQVRAPNGDLLSGRVVGHGVIRYGKDYSRMRFSKDHMWRYMETREERALEIIERERLHKAASRIRGITHSNWRAKKHSMCSKLRKLKKNFEISDSTFKCEFYSRPENGGEDSDEDGMGAEREKVLSHRFEIIANIQNMKLKDIADYVRRDELVENMMTILNSRNLYEVDGDCSDWLNFCTGSELNYVAQEVAGFLYVEDPYRWSRDRDRQKDMMQRRYYEIGEKIEKFEGDENRVSMLKIAQAKIEMGMFRFALETNPNTKWNTGRQTLRKIKKQADICLAKVYELEQKILEAEEEKEFCAYLESDAEEVKHKLFGLEIEERGYSQKERRAHNNERQRKGKSNNHQRLRIDILTSMRDKMDRDILDDEGKEDVTQLREDRKTAEIILSELVDDSDDSKEQIEYVRTNNMKNSRISRPIVYAVNSPKIFATFECRKLHRDGVGNMKENKWRSNTCWVKHESGITFDAHGRTVVDKAEVSQECVKCQDEVFASRAELFDRYNPSHITGGRHIPERCPKCKKFLYWCYRPKGPDECCQIVKMLETTDGVEDISLWKKTNEGLEARIVFEGHKMSAVLGVHQLFMIDKKQLRTRVTE